MKTKLVAAAVTALAAIFGFWYLSTPAEVYRWEFQAPARKLDGLFCSMAGPEDQLGPLFLLNPLSGSEELWLTGFEVEVIDPSSGSTSQETLCHNSLLDNEPGKARTQIFSLAQGNEPFHLPTGFAVPWSSSRPFFASAQMMNSRPDLIGSEFSHRLRVWYQKDSELWRKPKALEVMSVPAVMCGSKEDAAAAGCSYARLEGEGVRHQPDGPLLGGHWWVPPGRHVYSCDVTRRFWLEDGNFRCHAISLHLHSWASSFALKDETTGQVLWSTETRLARDGTLQSIGAYQSPEGILLEPGHKLVMEVVYDNQSSEEVSAMAVLSLYYRNEQSQD